MGTFWKKATAKGGAKLKGSAKLSSEFNNFEEQHNYVSISRRLDSNLIWSVVVSRVFLVRRCSQVHAWSDRPKSALATIPEAIAR